MNNYTTWKKITSEGNNHFYPFHVSERNDEGRCQFAQTQLIMHGFAVVSDVNVHEAFFSVVDDSHFLPNGTEVYEIRVKSNCGEWQDWQAIVGNIRIAPFVDWQCGIANDLLFDSLKTKFAEHFEIRYCGILYRCGDNYVQVINDDDEILRTINPGTLCVEYFSQISNMCYPLEEQIGDMVKFRKLYYAYDENDKRI